MYRWIFVSIVCLVAGFMFAACAPINPERCAITDWYQRGVSDGMQGKRDQLTAFAEICAKVGVSPDADAYRAGRIEGLKRFCTLDVGYNHGVSGHKNPASICPLGPSEIVSQAWTFGNSLYIWNQNLASVNEQLVQAEIAVNDAAASEEEIKRAKHEVRRLKRERARLMDYRDQLLANYGAFRASVSGSAVQYDEALG